MGLADKAIGNGPIDAAPNTTLSGIRLLAPGPVTWREIVVRNTTTEPVTLRHGHVIAYAL